MQNKSFIAIKKADNSTKTKEKGCSKKENPPLFLNLSNHPTSSWYDNQLAAAKEFGEIEDLSFPAISPSATESEIDQLVSQYVDDIKTRAEDHDLTVHIMGEMTFTYRLVSRLKALGIRCVASTSERIAEEHDGEKISRFEFVQFREY